MEDVEVKKTLLVADGFDGVENDDVENSEGQPSNKRIIQGDRLSFTVDYKWLINDAEEFPKDRELVVIDVIRYAQKWVDGRPVSIIPVTANQPWPNVDKLNAACAKSEWGTYNGKPQGPWQRQRAVYFVDIGTMGKFTWPSRVDTVGSDICVRDIHDKVRLMREFRGARVFATVTLGDTFFPTSFGGRQRPDLKINRDRWIVLGKEEKALPAPSTAALPAATPIDPLSGIKTVEEPSLAEQMGDEIPPFDGPFNDSPDINVPKVASPPLPERKPSAQSQKPAVNKRGVQKIAGGR